MVYVWSFSGAVVVVAAIVFAVVAVVFLAAFVVATVCSFCHIC